MRNKGALFLSFIFTFCSGIFSTAAAQDIVTSTSINVTSIQDVTVCVTPKDELAGHYIIQPRCDNINLVLRCPPSAPEERIIRWHDVVGRAVGIQCPPERPCADEYAPSCKDDHIDVIRIPDDPEDIRPLCVRCPISRFNLSPAELGVIGEKREGIQVRCAISGAYKTDDISDPSEEDTDFRRVEPSDWCRNDLGRIVLTPITEQAIDPINVCFEYPVGWPLDAQPWLTDCAGPIVVGPPVPVPDPPHGIDEDGFWNDTEDSGITLTSNMALVAGSHSAGSATNLPACANTLDSQRDYCLWKGTKDLFVLLHPLEGDSKFPNMNSTDKLAEFFEKISAAKTSGGLGITVHKLEQDPVPANQTRLVADSQMAIRIVEKPQGLSLPITKDTPIILGESMIGTPNSAGVTNVYTLRITQYICDLCGGDPDSEGNCENGTFSTDNCKSSAPSSATGDTLIWEYAKFVNQHEIGHSLNLVSPAHPNYGYHHDYEEPSYMMIPSVTYTKRGSRVTFHIPYEFCSSCATDALLTE